MLLFMLYHKWYENKDIFKIFIEEGWPFYFLKFIYTCSLSESTRFLQCFIILKHTNYEVEWILLYYALFVNKWNIYFCSKCKE